MASSRSKSKSHTAYYSGYNHTAQRRKRLERHMKKFPNDAQAQSALDRAKAGTLHYRRKTPKTEVWSSHNKKMAHLFRQIGDFNPNKVLLSADEIAEQHQKEMQRRKKMEQDSAPKLDDVL